LQQKAKVKKAFSTVATMVRIHLVSMLDVYELLQNTKRAWKKVLAGNTVRQPGLFAPLKNGGRSTSKINLFTNKIRTSSRQKTHFLF
jgi:hypothetical protein